MSIQEKRRYARAVLKPGLSEVLSALGAQVTWPNLEISDVLDLSYKGAAVRRPGMFPVAVQTEASIEVRLGLFRPFRVPARVAWANLDWVGLEFGEVPPEGHQAMGEFLDAKLLGTTLRPIEQVFFSPGASFTHWFQGPSGIHVFVWLDSARKIDRVNVDFGHMTVRFDRGMGRHLLSREQRKALLILSQMDKPGLPMEEFVRSLAPGV